MCIVEKKYSGLKCFVLIALKFRMVNCVVDGAVVGKKTPSLVFLGTNPYFFIFHIQLGLKIKLFLYLSINFLITPDI